MYYEFYIDVFFVVNLVMDFFILQLVNRMILGAANPLRSLAGAVLGAVGSGVILFLPFSSWKIRGLISYVEQKIRMYFGWNCLAFMDVLLWQEEFFWHFPRLQQEESSHFWRYRQSLTGCLSLVSDS